MDLDILPPGLDPWKVPALTPPPGVIPNFFNPESHAIETIVICSIVTAVMVLFLIVRTYVKLHLTHSVGWDDYSCIFASGLAIAYLGLIINVYQRGFGVHQWNFPIAKMTNSYKQTLNGLDTLYGPAMFFTKLSLLLLYFRLFSPNRTARWLVYLGIAFSFVLYSVYLFAYIFVCPSTSKDYVKCQDQLKVLSVSTSSVGLLSDFYMLFLPLFAVSQLHLDRKKKLGLVGVFLTGFLACLAGVLGLVYRIKLNQSDDLTWTTGPVVILTDVEITTGIIVSCMPTLAALFRKANRPSHPSKSKCADLALGSGSKTFRISASEHNLDYRKASVPVEIYRRIEEGWNEASGSEERELVDNGPKTPEQTWFHP